MHIQRVLHVGHLNSFLDLGDGDLSAKNRKLQMPVGLPGRGMLRLQIDRCINNYNHVAFTNLSSITDLDVVDIDVDPSEQFLHM